MRIFLGMHLQIDLAWYLELSVWWSPGDLHESIYSAFNYSAGRPIGHLTEVNENAQKLLYLKSRLVASIMLVNDLKAS